MDIEFRGNGHTNNSSRGGIKPTVIVDHVVAGSGKSCDNWFRSSGNAVSSAHFLVWEDGRVTQYVDIRNMAWANGLTVAKIPKAKASVVRARPNTNPNKYTISIEHAGYTGKLTEAQKEASIELHRWIRDEVLRIFQVEIPFNRTHIIGHFEIDTKGKPNCPGPDFPWNGIVNTLNGKNASTKPAPSGNVLKKGDKGDRVKKLQTDLMSLTYSLGKHGADGVYGEATVTAVKNFQKRYGLQQDGIAGPQVFTKLESLIKSDEDDSIGEVQVLVAKLNVRKSADFNSTVVGEVNKGDKIKVYTEKNGLYNIGGSKWISAGKKYVKLLK